ncbi:hypothetical protein BC828DRAFT_351340 [Blastocladiella britannica]|nr:hypothetical protein BC828DRAFT_351340 [Blastocladiella britannica]
MAKLQQKGQAKHASRKSTDSGRSDLSSSGDDDADAIPEPSKSPNLAVPAGPQWAFLDPLLVSTGVLRDPRDTVFIKTIAWLLIGSASALYLVLGRWSWWHFAAHAAWVGRHATTFVLMLHCVCHRPLFARHVHALNWIVPYVLAPFYGHTWDTFYFHHIKHHHIEDNGPHDLSSTLSYQRDSPLHFAIYFARFFFLTVVELPLYFYRKGWASTAFRMLAMESASWSMFAALGYIGTHYTSSTPDQAYLAATMCFAVPVVLMRFGMMSGNWAQHAFVDTERPDCDYVQSLTCIDNEYNALAFNDGYHTSHHLNPRRHWADHPGNLVACADDYAKHGTLVFRGIDFHITWFHLMTKNYKALATAYVHLDATAKRPSDDEIMRMLQGRVRRMSDDEIAAYYSKTGVKAAARRVPGSSQ